MEYCKGATPPLAVIVKEPLLTPQLELITAMFEMIRGGGCLIVTFIVAEQPLPFETTII